MSSLSRIAAIFILLEIHLKIISSQNVKCAAAALTLGPAKGIVNFNQTQNQGIHITGSISGLSPGLHGFHVHEIGFIRTSCKDTKGHFNPHNVTHGGPTDTIRHVGDFGNILANGKGVAVLNLYDHVISFSGENDILGRAIVVHKGVDDLGRGNSTESLKNGNSGPRAGCGPILVAADYH